MRILPNLTEKALLAAQIEYLQRKINLLPANSLTQQAAVMQTNTLINRIMSSLGESFFSYKPVRAGRLPILTEYNEQISLIKEDLAFLYEQVDILGQETNKNYNTLEGSLLDIEKRIAQIKSLLADFRIYSLLPSPNLLYVGDSFQNTSRIDQNSSLLAKKQCSVDLVAGQLTLPAKEINASGNVLNISITADSNGVPGNNNEYGTLRNSDIKALIDGNPDTWFEYERVGQGSSPLKLKLIVVLNTPTIVNFIRLTAVNFGTREWPAIIAMDTSLDGQDYLSIKDDLPIVDWAKEDEENIFTFNAINNPGVISVHFTPRKAKYIRISLQQNSSYLVETVLGRKERLAIGLKDIEINSYQYEKEGEIFSKDFLIGKPVKKIGLAANQTPNEVSSLGAINHFISVDSGQTWEAISPLTFDDTSIKEIVTIGEDNTNTIPVASATSVRWKALISRNSEGFTGAKSKGRETLVTELALLPKLPPFRVTLEKEPVEGSLSVLDPLGGCVGEKDNKYFVGYTKSNTQAVFQIPFSLADKFDSWERNIRVQVGNVEWTRVGTFLNSTAEDEHFKLNLKKNLLIFGDGTNGKIPDNSLPIFLWFDRERIHIDISKPLKLQLNWSCTGIKDTISIYRELPAQQYTQSIPKGIFRIKLDYENLLYNPENGVKDPDTNQYSNPFEITFSGTTQLESPVWDYQTNALDVSSDMLAFIDGSTEFYNYDVAHYNYDASNPLKNSVADRKYSIDLEEGVIYLPDDGSSDNLPETNSDPIITYWFHGREYIPYERMSFSKDLKEIYVDDQYVGKNIASTTSEDLISGSLVWNLTAQDFATDVIWARIFPKSIIFRNLTTNSIVEEWTEVPYINGVDEFKQLETKDYFYSVNYKKAILYSALTPFDNLRISFEFTNYFAEYQIGTMLERDVHWHFNGKNTKEFKLTEGYALKILATTEYLNNSGSLRLIYKTLEDPTALIAELEPNYTPVLSEYKLILVTDEVL